MSERLDINHRVFVSASLIAMMIGIACALTRPVRAADKRATAGKGERLEGKIVGVTDGDTVVLLVDRTQYTIRLQGIDAPEKDQPFGNQSKKALSEKIFDKDVSVLSNGLDKYGRTVGIIYTDHCVNTEMVREGWAWHCTRYSASKTLAAAEEEAREAKAGLWVDANPIPPWDWRRDAAGRRAGQPDDPFGVRDLPARSVPRPTVKSPRGDAREKPAAKDCWLTISSGVRHNSNCRYFRKSTGRECDKNEGRACKICGG